MAPVIAQQPAPPAFTPAQRTALGHWAALTGGVLLLSLVLLGVVLVLLSRQRRFMMARSSRRRKGKARTDAWAESARRVRVRGASGPDDDTVDIDPDDLSPDDVDGPRGGDDPKGPHQ